MKNETARREIESLDYYLQNHTDDYSEESHTAMMMAVKALDQEPCDDAISRQAVLDEAFEVDTKEYGRINVVGVDAIDSLPSVNPQEPFKPMVEIDLYSVIKQKYIERDVLDKIRAEIDKQEKWLLQAGCTACNVDIAFDAIKSVVAESEG